MADYKVLKVSEQEPKVYESANGTIYYIKVMLEGHNRPVSIGKKSPDALKVGDVVSGEITETQYDTDKFKAVNKAFTPGFKGEPRDNDRIVAQWAIGQAVRFVTDHEGPQDELFDEIEDSAKKFYAMVDRVKGGEKPKTEWGKAGEILKKPDVVIDELDEEPIDLSEIPF